MAIIAFPEEQDEGQFTDYTPDYLRLLRKYNNVPLMASIIDAKAEATVHKWRTEGPEAERVAKVFDKFTGNGKQNFKQLLYNATKTFLICGDAFLEIVYDGLEVENLVMLNPANVKIRIKNGMIRGYKEVDGKAKWKKEQILHFPWNPTGAMVHGTSDIERLSDILMAKNQIEDDCRRIYHRYIKPIHIVKLNTDDQTEIENFKAEWAKIKNIPETDIIVPKDYVEVERATIPQYSSLLPDPWRAYLNKEIVLSNRMPEVVLGEGAQANSEATAKIQYQGYRTSIRWIQKFIEDQVERQLISQITGAKATLHLEMTGETPEDKFNRFMEAYKIIAGTEAMPDTHKHQVLMTIVEEIGLWKQKK